MNVLNALRRSRKVWLALIAAAQTIIFALVPDFPTEVWQAIDALILAVIAGIAIEDAAEKAGKGRAVNILPMPEGNPTMEDRPPPPSVRAWTPPEE